MIRPKVRVETLEPGLLEASGPFAVLIDTDDEAWSDPLRVRALGVELLESGCRYFVCYGHRSESIHDSIDDVIITSSDWESVITTFHDDEPKSDVVSFFLNDASGGMKEMLVWVESPLAWLPLIAAESKNMGAV